MSYILDGATPMLQELMMVSRGYAADALNHASVVVRDAMIQKARSFGPSRFGADFSTGRRRLTGSGQGGVKGRYYSRFSHSTGERLHGLDEFIKFQASSVSMKSMIGFIDFRGFNAEIYKDGRKVGSRRVKGQGGVKKIGMMMENGGIERLTEKQKAFFKASGWAVAARRGYVKRKARPVVTPVFAAMSGQIGDIIEDKYAKALVKHAAKMSGTRRVG